MKNRTISTREIVMLLVLAVLLIGVIYYMFYYQPLKQELANLESQSLQLDDEITLASTKAQKKKLMEDELAEILSQPEDEITEIAPYDNAKIVMSQLNGILSASDNYKLNFKDPTVEKNGTVRRYVDMTFDCPTYEDAKAIIQALTASHWRCLINSLSVDINESPEAAPASAVKALSSEQQAQAEAAAISKDVQSVLAGLGLASAPVFDENGQLVLEEDPYKGILSSAVSVKASIVFFESTALAK